jgi:ribosomal protein L37AE/L43A
MPAHAGSGHVTAVIDIPCPDCDRIDAVRKEGLGTYRCGECGREFDQTDVQP